MGQLDVLSDYNAPLTEIILGEKIESSRRVKRRAETFLWEHGMQIIDEMIYKSLDDLSLVDDQIQKEDSSTPK